MRLKSKERAASKARFNWTTLGVLFGLLGMAILLPNFSSSTVQATTNTTNWQKSITLQSQNSSDFGNSNTDASLTQAAQTNANYATFIIQLRQDNIYTTNIYKDPNAPSDSALIHAIAKAHSLGMKVAFKLHLDTYDTNWRAYINPSDRNTWYTNYSYWLNYYATLAQQNQVEELVVGAELVSMSTYTSNSDNTQRWQGMIAQARQRFSGKMTYSANWGGSYFTEEFTHIGFWSSLDYIGISAYFNLVSYNNPSVSDLINSWNNWNIYTIQPYQQSIGKPVLFTEIGYRSVDGAAIGPWDYNHQGNYNAQEQVNALDALMQYWSGYSWFAGMHYWDWSTNSQCCGAGDTGYSVQNKPGQSTMRNDYGTNSAPAPYFLLVGSGVNPSSGMAGSTFSLNASVKSSTATSALIDMEVYDSTGNKVYQQYAANQSFAAGQTNNFTFSWVSPSNQAAGQYSLSIGVFSNDWTTNYIWAPSSGAVSITSASPTPTTTTAIPTNTPLPPTATPTQVPPTATKIPPTATANTPTATTIRPTNTPLPSTATPTPSATSYTLSIWWPANGVTVSGVQPFKARLEGLSLSQYNMYWQVDNGQLNLMQDNVDHKEAAVDVSGWNWRGSGPYLVNIVAKDLSGNILNQGSVQIYVQH